MVQLDAARIFGIVYLLETHFVHSWSGLEI